MATKENSIAGSGCDNVFIDSLIEGSRWSGTSISYSLNSNYDCGFEVVYY